MAPRFNLAGRRVSTNVEDRRSSLSNIMDMLVNPYARGFQSPDPFELQLRREKVGFDPFLVSPDLNVAPPLPLQMVMGNQEIAPPRPPPGSVPWNAGPMPEMPIQRIGPQSNLGPGAQGAVGDAGPQGASLQGETLTMGPNEEPVSSNRPPPDQVAIARDYLKSTAYPAPTMVKQGDAAIDRLHPTFAVKLAGTIQAARAAGINAGIKSAYRPTGLGVSGYPPGQEWKSIHSYGIGVDFAGIGPPRSATARQFQQIAQANGVYNPYGYRNGDEWNHYQHIPQEFGNKLASANPAAYDALKGTITKGGPIDIEKMWAAVDAVEAYPQTLAALGGEEGIRQYQATHSGLTVDGIVGPQTAGAIMAELTAGQIPAGAPQSALASLQPPAGGTQTLTPPSALQGFQPTIPDAAFGSPGQAAISDLISAPSTASDVDKLAGVMLAEGRGEGREGKIGVGNVVLNRANATGSRFPKTIAEVINSEFAKPLGPNDVSPDEWVETRTLATELLNGTIPDNTGGAVYFANTATASPNAYAEIAASGPVSATIGNHTYHVDTGIGPVVRGTGAPPPQRRPGPGGALGVDLGMQPAGMPPPPSRPGAFDWLGGGAPDAGLVPTPGISPLRPAMGGPGDRRPQPPIPPSRASGIPDPRMRPSGLQSLIGGRPEFPGAMPPAPFQTPYGGRQEVPGALPAATAPWNPLASARMNLPPTDPRTVGSDLTPEQLSRVRELQGIGPFSARPDFPAPNINTAWSDPSRGFDIPPPLSRMADAPPPVRPRITPDFDFAAEPGPTFTPPSLAPDIRGREEFPGSLPAAPPPLATAADDPYSQQRMSSFDTALPYAGFTPSPTTEPVSAPPPIPAMPRYDPLSSAYPPSAAPPAPPSPVSYTPFTSFGAGFDELGRPVGPIPTQPTSATGEEDIILPGTQPGAGSQLPDEPSIAYPSPMDVAIGEAGLGTPRQIRRSDPNRQSGFFGRIFGGGPGGFRSLPGFGSILNPGGFLNNMGAPPTFTPSGISGTSPYGTQGGTTNWQRGTSPNALGGGNRVTGPTQGLSWQSSGGGNITAYTDPWTGQTFHSFGP